MIVGLFWLCIRSLCGGQHHRGGRGPGMLMIVGLFWLCIRSLCGAVDLADRFQKSSDDVTLCRRGEHREASLLNHTMI